MRRKRNRSRMVLRFSPNSMRPAGLRTSQKVLSQWVEPGLVRKKNLGENLFLLVGLLAVFWEILNYPQRWPPILEDWRGEVLS